MEDPPPGDNVPPAGRFVTISNESGMETDGSASTRALKRSKHRVNVCKHCNKRRRKHQGQDTKDSDCSCTDPPLSPKTSTTTIFEKNSTTNVEINNKEVSPPTPIGRTCYNDKDASPYVVHIIKTSSTPNEDVSVHPVTFGRFLKKNSFQNIVNGSVKKIGRNKISIAFSNHLDANAFMKDKSLESNNMRAFIPTFNVTRMGLVRGVPSDWSPEEVIANVSLPIGTGEIIKVRRLNYKTIINGAPIWKPSQTVVITFDGQILPDRIFICYNSLPVELYIYPTLQCFLCCRFGHTKAQCRSKPRCFKCGQNHTGDTCDVEEENASCCLCSGSHFASSKSCPEFARQKSIKTYMAQNAVSYFEASKLHPLVGKSYADVLTSRPAVLTSSSINITPSPERPKPRPYRYIGHHMAKNVSPSTSYKKTVFLKPKSPPISSNKGYDKEAHKALIKEYSIPTPSNGCALNSLSHDQVQQLSSETSIPDLIIALINLLSNFTQSTPSNDAPTTLVTQSEYDQYGQTKSSAVEL